MEVPLVVNDFLRRAVKLYPGQEAVVNGELRLTYAEFGARVNQLANALLALGVGKGDRVAILSPNSHQFLEVLYATAAIGAGVVPINYRLIASDFEYVLSHSGTMVAVVDSDYAADVEGLRDKLPAVEHYVTVRFETEEVAARLGGLRSAGRGAAGDAAAGSGDCRSRTC